MVKREHSLLSVSMNWGSIAARQGVLVGARLGTKHGRCIRMCCDAGHGPLSGQHYGREV